MKISVIIPTFNRKKKLSRLIDSLVESDFSKDEFEIIVVDDCSTDGTCEYIAREYRSAALVRIIGKTENKKKSHSVNIGWKAARGAYIFVIDDDTVVDSQTLSVLYKKVTSQKKMFACPIMYYFDAPEYVWSAGIQMNFWTTTGKFLHQGVRGDVLPQKDIRIDGGVTAFMVSRDIVDDIGFFNETLLPFQFEELDYCVRAGVAGYTLITVPGAKIWHDHETGIFLNNPWRLYFEVRNRIITAVLWSTGMTQRYVALLCSLMIPFSYVIIKLVWYRRHTWQSLGAICRGIWDGLRLSVKITPYHRRTAEHLKDEVL